MNLASKKEPLILGKGMERREAGGLGRWVLGSGKFLCCFPYI